MPFIMMPVKAELFHSYNGVNVYHCYKDNLILNEKETDKDIDWLRVTTNPFEHISADIVDIRDIVSEVMSPEYVVEHLSKTHNAVILAFIIRGTPPLDCFDEYVAAYKELINFAIDNKLLINDTETED